MPYPKYYCKLTHVKTPAFFDKLITSLLALLGRVCSRATATWLVVDAGVSILKVFHTPSNTARPRAHISIHTPKSLVRERDKYLVGKAEQVGG